MRIFQPKLIIGLLAVFLCVWPARGQEAAANAMQTLINSACASGMPNGFVEFKKRQIARRMADDEQTLTSLNADQQQNAASYSPADQNDYRALVNQLNAEIWEAGLYLQHDCPTELGAVAAGGPPTAAAAVATTPVDPTAAPPNDPATAPKAAEAGKPANVAPANGGNATNGQTLANAAAPAIGATPGSTSETTAEAKKQGAKKSGDAQAQAGAAAPPAAPTPKAGNEVKGAAGQGANVGSSETEANATNQPAVVAPPAGRPVPAAAGGAAAAPFTLSGTKLPFAKQELGQKSTAQTLTVTNPGSTDLTLNKLAVAGANAGDFSVVADNCGAPIPKNGGTCTFSVFFQPSTVGDETASIPVAAGGTSVSVSLSGTGQNPATAPKVFGPLVNNQKVVSGTADKTAIHVNIDVYGADCDKTKYKDCAPVAAGYTANFDGSSGMFSVELYESDAKPYTLKTNDFVMVTETVQTAMNGGSGPASWTLVPANPVPLQVQQASYSESTVPWGNVTPTFSTGFMLSQNNGQFSQYNFYLDLNVDTSYHISSDPQKRLNAFVDAQLTSVAAASCQSQTGAAGSGAASGGSGAASAGANVGAACLDLGNGFSSFLSSQKAAVVQGGLYYPWLIPTAKWSYGGHTNALFLGPIVKGGLQNVISTSQTTTNPNASAASSTTTTGTTTSTVAASGLYGNYSFGARFGHFQLWDSWNVAPDLLSYMDVTFGKWTNLYQCPTQGCNANATNLTQPFMLGVEGKLKVPSTPMILGFSTIKPFATSAKTDFRFTVGIKTDLSCLLTALKTPSVLNSSGSCEKTTGTTQKTTAETAVLTVASSTLPDAKVKASYSETIQLQGGKSPYKWTVTEGFPEGLKLNSSTGQITGTPTQAGTDSFVVTVTDSSTPTMTATKNLTIKVTQ